MVLGSEPACSRQVLSSAKILKVKFIAQHLRCRRHPALLRRPWKHQQLKIEWKMDASVTHAEVSDEFTALAQQGFSCRSRSLSDRSERQAPGKMN